MYTIQTLNIAVSTDHEFEIKDGELKAAVLYVETDQNSRIKEVGLTIYEHPKTGDHELYETVAKLLGEIQDGKHTVFF